MKTLTNLIMFISLLLLSYYPANTYSQEKSNDTELSIPWDEFKKLINLDGDEIVISIEMYQKILAQSGTSYVPQQNIKNGNVILKRDEFQKLINKMKPPDISTTTPPFDYLITKAVYSGKMRNKNTDFKGSFKVHVLKKDSYIEIPVLRQSIALSEIEVNGKPALVVARNGYHNVIVSKEGEYDITANFSIKSSLIKGPNKFNLPIQQTPITLLTLEIPMEELDVEIPEAQQLLTNVSKHKTTISAVLTQKSSISVEWKKQIEAAEKIPAKLYSEITHLISIDDDVFKIDSDINYKVLHSEINLVEVIIPDNINVLSVNGDGVGEWNEVRKNEQRGIKIPFTYGRKGNITIRITSETTLSENGLTNIFSGFKTTNTVRETGFIGVALNTNAEVIVSDIDGLEKVAVQKLPAQLVNKSAKPLMMGFKYLKHPYNLVLDIKKHEKIGVPLATINSANVVTLFTEDGKIVHRIVYHVRNSSKQFLEIKLPDNSDVWSVFVNNQPVESSVNGEGELLIPLIRSQKENNRLNTFPVEIIYNMSDNNFSYYGSAESNLPSVDLLVSQLIWSVYLPNDYSYKYFASTLEKEEIIRSLNLFSESGRQYDESLIKNSAPSVSGTDRDFNEVKKLYKGNDYRSKFRNNALKEEQMMSQVEAELDFSRRLDDLKQVGTSTIYGGSSAGIMPIQIEIPTSGQVYRFAKSIIKPEDELSFSVIYTQMWVNDLVKWSIIISVLLTIYFNRNRFKGLFNFVSSKIRLLIEYIKKNEVALKSFMNSIYMPISLFVLIVLLSSLSYHITVILIAGFIVSSINLIGNYINKRKSERIELKTEVGSTSKIEKS